MINMKINIKTRMKMKTILLLKPVKSFYTKVLKQAFAPETMISVLENFSV